MTPPQQDSISQAADATSPDLGMSRIAALPWLGSLTIFCVVVAVSQPVAVERPLVSGGLGAVLLTLAYCDLRWRRLPDVLTLPLIAAGLAVSVVDDRAAAALAGAFLGYGVIWALRRTWMLLRATEGIGLGDAKLLAAAGAWLGAVKLPLVLLVASGAGLLLAIAIFVTLRKKLRSLPFGPLLVAGFWLGWNLPYLLQP